jgi:glycerophosphoryl diester phosphodiesterase
MTTKFLAAAGLAVAMQATLVTQVQASTACPVISARLGLHYPYYVSPHVAFPENSVGAVVGAHQAGATKVEVNVTFSKDVVPIAFHDTTVNRTTAHTGAVASYTAAQLIAMPLRMEGLGTASSWMSSQHVATTEQLLAQAQNLGMTASIEVKPTSLSSVQARQLLRTIWSAGGTNNSVEATSDVRSYYPGVLQAMRAAGYWGRLTLIVGSPQPVTGYWMESVDYFNDWPGAPVAVPVPLDAVKSLQANGVLVDGYTPDTAAQIAVTGPGLNQITTNNVHAAVSWEQTEQCQ